MDDYPDLGLIERANRAREEQKRRRIEKAARPGETYEQTKFRLQQEADHHPVKTSIRKPPVTDVQPDFFIPSLYDVGTRDSRSIMDVAVFRLSKRQKRAGEVLRYDLPDGYVEVKAGPDGMASIWDYDIILMLVSHLTEAMNRFREGKGDKPGRVFKPHISEILKFCRKGDGSRQFAEVEAALDRLSGTTIKSEREITKEGRCKERVVESEGLINRYRVTSRTDTGKVASVEIEAPDWLYREVTEGRRPEVLTVHPDYFLIEPGIGRFIYRLARRAAGKSSATWSFRILYERSGSTGSFKKFTENLRRIISANDLPEYLLSEEVGKEGPLLLMHHRDVAPPLKASP